MRDTSIDDKNKHERVLIRAQIMQEEAEWAMKSASQRPDLQVWEAEDASNLLLGSIKAKLAILENS